jgi:hypothetical protein
LLGKLRNDILVKDVTHYPVPRHGVPALNAQYRMWKAIRKPYPDLNETFYGLDLHDTPDDYHTVDGVHFTACNSLDRSMASQIGITYYERNDKLRNALMQYASGVHGGMKTVVVRNVRGELVRDEGNMQSKDGNFHVSDFPKSPYGLIEVELHPYTSKEDGIFEGRLRFEDRDMAPEEAATKLSNMISFLLSSL